MSNSAPGWSFGRVFGLHGSGSAGSKEEETDEEAMAISGAVGRRQASVPEQASVEFEALLVQLMESLSEKFCGSSDFFSRTVRCSEDSECRQTTLFAAVEQGFKLGTYLRPPDC
jgi:hypothetical protein